jgi:hypothetical protein
MCSFLKKIIVLIALSCSLTNYAQVYEIVSPKQSFDIQELFIPPSLSIPSQKIVFNDANNNRKLDADETVEIKFRVSNSGAGMAKNLKLSIENVSNFRGIQIIKPPQLSRVFPNDNAEFSFKIKANNYIKSGKVNLKIMILEPNGINSNVLEYSFSTLEFLKPELKIIDPIFSASSSEYLERKKPLKLDFIVQNIGQGNAENLKIKLQHNPNITPMGKQTFKFDNYAVGQAEHIVYEFIVPDCEINNNGQDCNGEFSKSDNFEFKITVSEDKAGKVSNESIMLNLNTASGQKISVNHLSDDYVAKEIVTASLISDVDKNIPKNDKKSDNKIAVIIGNEKYSTGFNSQSDVAYAENDANSVYKYLTNTLGFKSEYCFRLTNATKSQMESEIRKMIDLSKLKDGEAELFFYYAGHGFPDEETQQPYLVPVDAQANLISQQGLSLNDLYNMLGKSNAKMVTVCLDACFSGGGREGVFADARSVRKGVKEVKENDNMIILSSSQGDQKSLPYHDKNHGVFTYFLLKKIKETKGKVTYEDVFKYLKKEVSERAILDNFIQTPRLKYSEELDVSKINILN